MCVRARACVRQRIPRIVRTGKILRFMNTLVIITIEVSQAMPHTQAESR